VLPHHGPYETLGAAYRALGIWMLRHDLEPTGPPREVYLTGPAPGRDPLDYRTELLWPVERR
jgi:effector-binding domain-containing protein